MRYSLMLCTLYFFIVECGIARFLCAMRVFDIRASSSSPRPPLCQISFLWRLPLLKNWRKIAYSGNQSITQSLTHSLTQLIWCPGTEAFASEFPLCYCLVVGTSAIDCLERLVSEMTYYVSSGTLNPTHSLTRSPCTVQCTIRLQV